MIKVQKLITRDLSSPIRLRFLLAGLLVHCLSMPVTAHGPGHDEINKITAQLSEQGEQADLYLKRGRIFESNQLWQEAMDDFNRAAQLDPGYVEFDLDRARLSYSAGDYLRALDFINLYLLRDGFTTEAWLIQARSYRQLSQYQQAVKSYQAAMTNLSNFEARPLPEWYIEFADTLLLTGDKVKALAIMQKGIDRLGAISVFQVKAAELEVDLGLYDSALGRIDQLLSQSQRKDLWLARRADILARAGRQQEARQTYAEALAALQRLPLRMQNQPVSRELADSLQARIAAR